MLHTEKPTILVVDDIPENIDLLDGILAEDYNVRAALNGKKALEIVSKNSVPDLVLLDVMMPEMDGYQVCRQLKENSTTRKIPVIFVTARTDLEGELKGLDLGAVDYITKPFDPALVKARIRTHIELKMIRDQIEALAQTRAQQLVHAERLSTIGLLSAGIAHEINTPLTFIKSHADFIKKDLNELQIKLPGALKQDASPKKDSKEAIDEIISGCSESIREVIQGARRIETLVRNLKHFSRQNDQEKSRIDCRQCIENAVNLCRFHLKIIDLHMDVPDRLPEVTANDQQIEQVLINLIKNAADALENTESPKISIMAKTRGTNLVIRVVDNGPGISEEGLSSIWEAFYTTKAADKGTGLGLSISRGIIEDHGGGIDAMNLNPTGAGFTIKLPIADVKSHTDA